MSASQEVREFRSRGGLGPATTGDLDLLLMDLHPDCLLSHWP